MNKDFIIERQSFYADIDRRTGTPHVHSIHPYDETEYHWARKSHAGMWVVYRSGKQQAILAGSLTEEQVAAELLKMDEAAHLTRRGGIW